MSMEWFDRVCSELQDHMESICEKYDEFGHITIDRAAKHPRIECFIELEDGDREFFCTLFFDPHNEEFYVEEFDIELEQTSRRLLHDIDDIIDEVHESIHDFVEGEDLDDEDDYIEDDEDDDEYEYVMDDEDGEDIVVDVEWTTPEVLAYSYMDEVEVAYQFGVIQETGDGVLRRVNRIWQEDDEAIEDETNFIFSREEAGTILELIENNIDLLDGFEEI